MLNCQFNNILTHKISPHISKVEGAKNPPFFVKFFPNEFVKLPDVKSFLHNKLFAGSSFLRCWLWFFYSNKPCGHKGYTKNICVFFIIKKIIPDHKEDNTHQPYDTKQISHFIPRSVSQQKTRLNAKDAKLNLLDMLTSVKLYEVIWLNLFTKMRKCQ